MWQNGVCANSSVDAACDKSEFQGSLVDKAPNWGLCVVCRRRRVRVGDSGTLRAASCFTNESMFSTINQNAHTLAAVIP